MKEVKPSPDRRMVKLLTFDNLFYDKVVIQRALRLVEKACFMRV